MARICRCRAISSTTSTPSAMARSKVAEVSKRWFRLADTYGVLIEPSQNDIVILAVTVAVDMMAHP